MYTRLLIDHSEYMHIALDGAILAEVFDGVLKDLGLVDRNDPEVGVRDPLQLRELAFEAVRIQRTLSPRGFPAACAPFPPAG
jgi:hypothetical protein